MHIEIETRSLQNVTQWLKTKQDRLTNMRPVLSQIAIQMVRVAKRNLDEKHRQDALDWKPLSPFTLFVKRHRAGKQDNHPKPLRDSGKLFNSIQSGISESETIAEAWAGSNLPYAELQNKGGKSSGGAVKIASYMRKTKSGMSKVKSYTMNIKPGHEIPARPFMVMFDNEFEIIANLLKDYIYGSQK